MTNALGSGPVPQSALARAGNFALMCGQYAAGSILYVLYGAPWLLLFLVLIALPAIVITLIVSVLLVPVWFVVALVSLIFTQSLAWATWNLDDRITPFTDRADALLSRTTIRVFSPMQPTALRWLADANRRRRLLAAGR